MLLTGNSSIPLQVFLDGKMVKTLIIDQDKKYDLVNTFYGKDRLTVHVPQGISAYVFTFGDE